MAITHVTQIILIPNLDRRICISMISKMSLIMEHYSKWSTNYREDIPHVEVSLFISLDIPLQVHRSTIYPKVERDKRYLISPS